LRIFTSDRNIPAQSQQTNALVALRLPWCSEAWAANWILDYVPMVEKVPMTAEGHAAMSEEVKHRKSVERPRIIKAIEAARAHGDLSENAEYHAAKEAQGWNEARVSELEDMISRAEIIDVSKLGGDTVKFGATVTVVDEDTDKKAVYRIVGDFEADVKSGKLSISSPIARALIGKSAGDSVEVMTPGGGKSYKILKIAFK